MSYAIAVAATGAVLVFGLLTGCATRPSPTVYQKSNVTDADQQRDENICLQASVGLDDRGKGTVTARPRGIEWDAYTLT
jgi:hypothetical protein